MGACAFDLTHYRELLEAAKAGGYEWASFDRHPRAGDLYLRHDVDLSLEAALEMARARARGRRARDVLPDDRERLLQPRLARRPLRAAAAPQLGPRGRPARRVSARRARRALRPGGRVAQPRSGVHGAADRRRGQRDGGAVLHAGALPLRLEPRAGATGCPHERARRRRVRVAAAARPSGDLGVRGRDDARDDGVDARREARGMAGRCSQPTGSTCRDDDHRHRVRARRARRRSCARCARTASARCGSSASTCRSARSAATSATRSTSSRPAPTPASPTPCSRSSSASASTSCCPQSSFDLAGLAAHASGSRCRCSSRRPRRCGARTTRRRRTRSCSGSACPTLEFRRVAGAREVEAAARELGYPDAARLLQAGLLVRLARLPHPRPDRRPRAPAPARAARLGGDAARGGGRAPARPRAGRSCS